MEEVVTSVQKRNGEKIIRMARENEERMEERMKRE